MPKIDEVCFIVKETNAPTTTISETELDLIILSNELEVDGYDLLRMDWSRKATGVPSFIKSWIAYSY